MLKSRLVPFDSIANEYDDVFSRSLIGRYQREITRDYLQSFLRGKEGLRILEINCGTGEDALWLASLGHEVIASDQSERMICIAQQKAVSKLPNNKPRFIVSGFDQLDTVFSTEQFDLIFSNFSGLNCVSETQLSQLNLQLNLLMKTNGHFAAVIFGKYNWWETVYYLSKIDFAKAFRRWSNAMVLAKLSHQMIQPVYYHSIHKFVHLFNQFSFVDKRPVGLFIPPSYLEVYFRKNSKFFSLLARLEKKAGSIRMFSPFGDHVYVLLKKAEK